MNAPISTTTLQQAIPTIASKATKFRLQRGTGKARIRDKHAEEHLKETLGDDGRYVGKAIFKDPSNPINKRAQLANELYAYVVKNTLPHTDDGWRLLPNNLYFVFSQEVQNYVAKLEQYDQLILANYDNLVQADINARLIKYNDKQREYLSNGVTPPKHFVPPSVDDYPTKSHIESLLYVRYYYEPITTANDFRYNISEADKTRLNDLLLTVEANAKADLYKRMIDPMAKFVEKLSVPIGQDGSIFRDSLVGNLNDLLNHLPKLNIDNDPVIDQKLMELEAIVRPYVFNPDSLRENQATRDAAKQKVEELMKSLDGYAF